MGNDVDYRGMDRRVVARMVRKGILNDKEVEKGLKGLPDLAEKALPIETVFEETQGDFEDDEA